MKKNVEIEYRELRATGNYDELINKVIAQCFKTENLQNTKLYVSIILTTPNVIRQTNREYRNIDQETDVLSFPMFEKDEIQAAKTSPEVLGDIIVCIPRVIEQAKEYGHSRDREFAYMLVHGFYHLMGYDHIEEEDKKIMRAKEEVILKKVGIERK